MLCRCLMRPFRARLFLSDLFQGRRAFALAPGYLLTRLRRWLDSMIEKPELLLDGNKSQ